MSNISLKQNTIANYIGQLYSILIGIVILPLYLEYLGAEAYGLIGFFTMLTSWMMLLDIGLSTTLTRESAYLKHKPNGYLDLKKLIRSIEALFLIISIFMIVMIYCGSSFLAINWLEIKTLPYNTVEHCIKLMGVTIVLRWFVGFYRGFINGLERQVWGNLFRILFNTLKFVGAFLLIKYITHNIFYFFVYQLIIGILEYLVILRKAYKLLPKTVFLLPSIIPLKRIAPFALGIAYTTLVWVLVSQSDKLLLSHYMPLSEYGYFTLVVVISGAVMQLSSPISQAIIPRLTSHFSKDNKVEMHNLYHKGTQFIAIIIFSVVAIIVSFPYELLYAWTGDKIASAWGAPVLIWYTLGNGILAVLAFQYYLQYAHGNLKYHIRFNIVSPLVILPSMFFAVIFYGALGAGITWFCIQLFFFLVWPPFIHHKFAKGIHFDWIVKDILPACLISFIYICILKTTQINFENYNRLENFSILIIFGIILLILNTLAYSNTRRMIFRIYSNIKIKVLHK